MSHPYRGLPSRAFWSSSIMDRAGPVAPDLYRPRVRISAQTPVATAGSCFAQHIGQWLRRAGCAILDVEPRPRRLPPDEARRRGYGLYSARYGNVYTARQLRELLEDAEAGHADPRLVWERPDGRFVDALRPTIEPEGLDSPEEVLALRRWHLARVRQLLRRAEVLVFTLGLTETWVDLEAGRALPVCPGVSGGTFDPERHAFRNVRTAEVLADLHAARACLQRVRPGLRMILTVSPVPLAATASGDHVLPATVRSKSTLRAAAAEFVEDVEDADYFPSFELATQPAAGGPWFGPNLRDIEADGVGRIMRAFLAGHGIAPGSAADAAAEAPPPAAPGDAPPPASAEATEDDLVCDEVLLQAFAR